MHQWTGSELVLIIACRLFDTKPLSKPMLGYCQMDTYEKNVNQNTTLFIHENASENIGCEMAAILSRGDELRRFALCDAIAHLIQLSAVITRSNIVSYYINNYKNWGRILFTCWIHINTPYLALTGELWGVFCEYLWENLPRYNGTALYYDRSYSKDFRFPWVNSWSPKYVKLFSKSHYGLSFAQWESAVTYALVTSFIS